MGQAANFSFPISSICKLRFFFLFLYTPPSASWLFEEETVFVTRLLQALSIHAATLP